MKIDRIFQIICITCVFMSVSCSSDDITDNGDDKPASGMNVTFNISSATFGSNATRSITDEGPEVGDSDEWIKTWTLVILDNTSKKIEKIITRPNTTNMIQSESYSMALSSGEKTIFAVGNMSAADAGISYSEGSVLTDAEITNIKTNTSTMADGNGFVITAPTKYLPMSNIVYATISNKQQQSVNIPLCRLLAKLQFSFTSEASKDVTVQSVMMNPLTTSNVYTWPTNVQFNVDKSDYSLSPLLPASAVSGNYTNNWGTVVTAGNTVATTKSFYVNESRASSYSDHLVFTVNTVRDGKSEEENYTLTDLAYIDRNDYIKIPVVLTDYIFAPKATFYPPIGGYPTVYVTNTDDKSYFVFNNAGGDFVINPNIHKANDMSLVETKNVKIQIDTNPSLFAVIPAYDAIDGTIIGELGTSAGTSQITLTVDVKTGVSGVTRTLTRKMYIVVQ